MKSDVTALTAVQLCLSFDNMQAQKQTVLPNTSFSMLMIYNVTFTRFYHKAFLKARPNPRFAQGYILFFTWKESEMPRCGFIGLENYFKTFS